MTLRAAPQGAIHSLIYRKDGTCRSNTTLEAAATVGGTNPGGGKRGDDEVLKQAALANIRSQLVDEQLAVGLANISW